MQTKALFSVYYLERRLPNHPEWEDDPRPAFEAIRALWEKAQHYGDGWNEAQTEDEFVKPVLEASSSRRSTPSWRRGRATSRQRWHVAPDCAAGWPKR